MRCINVFQPTLNLCECVSVELKAFFSLSLARSLLIFCAVIFYYTHTVNKLAWILLLNNIRVRTLMNIHTLYRAQCICLYVFRLKNIYIYGQFSLQYFNVQARNDIFSCILCRHFHIRRINFISRLYTNTHDICIFN